jgi:type IV pilus assembly protein PilX
MNRYQCQQGAALVITLVMLLAVLMMGVSAAQIAMQGERATRNDRDRQIAFQAAEAALLDAEADIENSTAGASRSALFSRKSALGFPAEGEAICGTSGNALGLCRDDPTPAWKSVNFMSSGTGAQSVPYGQFTGQNFPIGDAALPGRIPRYIIELKLYNRAGANADDISYFYRVTAVGFGTRDSTQIMLQTYYRKEG